MMKTTTMRLTTMTPMMNHLISGLAGEHQTYQALEPDYCLMCQLSFTFIWTSIKKSEERKYMWQLGQPSDMGLGIFIVGPLTTHCVNRCSSVPSHLPGTNYYCGTESFQSSGDQNQVETPPDVLVHLLPLLWSLLAVFHLARPSISP